MWGRLVLLLDLKKLQVHKIVISFLIAAYLLIVGCQIFPTFFWQVELNAKTTRYVRFFGFEQSYEMFANPAHCNRRMFGVVTYRSGLFELFSYPRGSQFNILEKMRYERFRKFFNDNLESESLIHCRADFARYVARLYKGHEDVPLLVSLVIVSTPIPPPGQQLAVGNDNAESKSSIFINYIVQPEDLL